MMSGTLFPIIIADLGFPVWLRLTHFINLLFLGLLVRSGIQILADHPRLYWRDGCNPDLAWLKFTRKKVPIGELYTSMDDAVPATPLLGQPGKEMLGIGRHWHFFSVAFWLLNGITYIVLLFATNEWTRLIPTSWSIVPGALQSTLTYLTLHRPPKSVFQPYDPLQQLIYAFVVFILAPFMLLTGATMSPAIEARFPWYIKIFGGRQSGRSLHFLSMVLFVIFTIIHTIMIFAVYFTDNIRNIVLGSVQASLWVSLMIAGIALACVFGFYAWSSWFSLRHPRRVQHVLGFIVDPIRKFFLHHVHSIQHYKPSDITPYFWVNGKPPVEKEFRQLWRNNFRDWRLHIDGEIPQALSFSLDELRKLPKQTQITKHNCIQGWSGVAEWGGVPLTCILDLCQPKPEAKYVVFTSYQLGQQSYPKGPKESLTRPFYEVIDMTLARHPQTILAYEMNGRPLPLAHGAPLRLRCETQLGYKMVKYLRSIDFVSDYSMLGDGQGGFREDIQYYGRGAEI
jgi:methionine sulfoxide reductase catalytic subunit